MTHPYWPLFDLKVTTPIVELRLPTDDELVRLAAVAGRGIHDPATMPFAIPWSDQPTPALERGALQWWWRQRAEWTPARWNLTAGVFVGGEPVGFQDLGAANFGILRTFSTGSWLGRAHQGRGIGKEMRAAALHLAFAGLGAVEGYSGAWHDNAASMGVSRSLGYVENGQNRALRRDVADRIVNLRIERSAWEARRRDDIVIEGLEPCLELFGVA